MPRALDEPVERKSIYLACEELDFVWDKPEVKKFNRLWKLGLSIKEISEALKRDPDEVVILAMDQARNQIIRTRKNGIFGIEDTREPTIKPINRSKGLVTVYEIDGQRYVLDHPSTYKGAKAK